MADQANLPTPLSPVRQHWMPSEQAIEQYLAYEERHSRGHALLACHAAFPLIVTPELVNLIRINFLTEQAIDWVAETDFLLVFCHPIDAEQGLYQIDPGLREVMLADLQESAYGMKRLYELGDFLLAYGERYAERLLRPDIARVHQWIAWSYLYPQKLVNEMKLILQAENYQSLGDVQIPLYQIHIATMLEVMSDAFGIMPPILEKQYQELVERSHVVLHYWYFDFNYWYFDFNQTEILSDSINSKLASQFILYNRTDKKDFLRIPRTYTNQEFVNREQEIALVRNRLDTMLKGYLVEKRTFIFTGQHGIGKSWFLLHLQNELSNIRDVKVLHLDLAGYLHDLTPQATLLKICVEVSDKLLAGMPIPHTGLDAATGFLVNAIKRSLSPQQVLVILLDTVFEAPGDLLGTLENYLLAPLAIEHNVMMVLAGRGREYPWKTPELRLHAEFHKLELFDEAATAQQLRQYVPNSFSRAGEIFHISCGNPKTTLLLAVNGNSIAVLNQVIEEMLPLVAQDERILMREYLEALSIPRGFDQGHLPHLLNVYYSSQTTYPRRDLRLILDRLLEPGLIYWNTEQLTYTLHEAMRNLLSYYLRHAKPELWRKLHECCVVVYQEWVDAQPRNWEKWQAEITYHQRELYLLNTENKHYSSEDVDISGDFAGSHNFVGPDNTTNSNQPTLTLSDNYENDTLATNDQYISWPPLWSSPRAEELPRIAEWVRLAQLKFNPFGPEQAEWDPELLEQHVYPPVFGECLRNVRSAIIFGAPGSGKTACKLLLTHTCHIRVNGPHDANTFPVPCSIDMNTDAMATVEAAQNFVVEHLARALIPFFALNPFTFLALEDDAKLATVACWRQAFSLMENVKTQMFLAGLTNHSLGVQMLREFDQLALRLQNISFTQRDWVGIISKARPKNFVRTFIICDLANVNLATLPIQAAYLQQLIDYVVSPVARGVYLKAFFPDILQSHLTIPDHVAQCTLTWAVELLEQMLKERVRAESEHKIYFEQLFDHEARLTNPARRLAEAAQGSPRQIVRLGNHLLAAHVRRRPGEVEISNQDLTMILGDRRRASKNTQ